MPRPRPRSRSLRVGRVASEVIVLEADPSGGSLAGWLDTPSQPSLATIVANVGADSGRDHRSSFATFDAMTQHSSTGVRFVANAVRSRACASRARRGSRGGAPGARCRRLDGARRCRRPSCGHRAVAGARCCRRRGVGPPSSHGVGCCGHGSCRAPRRVGRRVGSPRCRHRARRHRQQRRSSPARSLRSSTTRCPVPSERWRQWRTIHSPPPRSPGVRVCRHDVSDGSR